MIEKKSAKGNLSAKKTTFLLIGFVFVLAIVVVGFELFATQLKTDTVAVEDPNFLTVVEEEVKSTDQTPPPAPPKPLHQEIIISLVDNLKKVEIDLPIDPGYNEDDAIPDYEPIEIIPIAVDNTPPVYYAEKLPEFPGGMERFYEMLRNELQYPETARAAGIQGPVVIEFVVEKNGSISNPTVYHSLFPDCDKEAIRALLQMPKWKPAEQLGKFVRCYYKITIQYSLR